MEEKRKHKRYVIEGLDVKCRMVFATEVQILDLSLSGAAIIVDKRLNMGGRYAIKVQSDGTDLSLNGEVVWVTIYGSKKTPKGEVVPLYKAGIRFDDVLSNTGEALMDLLSDSADRQRIKPRLGGVRVKIDAGNSVLDYPTIFKIKKISLGGMLMETSQKLVVESRYPMEVFLTKGKGQPLTCTGRVASCAEHPSGHDGLYDIGIEFMDVNDTDRTRLSRFISALEER